MKAKLYVRVAKDDNAHRWDHRTKAIAQTKLNREPLTAGDRVLPTVYFAIDLDVADDLFEQAERVIASMEVTGAQAEVAAQVASV